MKLNDKITSRFRKSTAAGQGGFTMIELLISMFLLSIVMTMVFAFLWGASSYWETGQAAADVTDNARMGLNRITRELKQGSGVTMAYTSYLTFVADFGSGDETITYGFTPPAADQPGILWRESSLAPGVQLPVVNNIDALRFDYYGNDYRCDVDGNGEVTESELQAGCAVVWMSKISRVDVTMTMATGNDGQKEFFGQGWLRNRSTVEGA